MRAFAAALFIVCVPSLGVASVASADGMPEPPVVVYGPAPPERAPPETDQPAPLQTTWMNGGFAVGLGTVVFQPDLAGTRFKGSGVPLDGLRREPFSHLGREIGIQTPVLWGGELRLDYMRRYFEIGIHGFLAGHPGSSDPASNRLAASIADSSSIFAYGGGIRLAGAMPAGPISLSLGPDIGIRGFSIPLPGYQPTTCSSKHGTYPCAERATALQPYVQPRFTISWNADERGGVFLAGWIGSDLYPSPTMAGGLVFGVGTPHEAIAP